MWGDSAVIPCRRVVVTKQCPVCDVFYHILFCQLQWREPPPPPPPKTKLLADRSKAFNSSLLHTSYHPLYKHLSTTELQCWQQHRNSSFARSRGAAAEGVSRLRDFSGNKQHAPCTWRCQTSFATPICRHNLHPVLLLCIVHNFSGQSKLPQFLLILFSLKQGNFFCG